ncbi:hypothetical protein EDB86DRAFT_2954734, partial [Lactarius hatsudake]
SFSRCASQSQLPPNPSAPTSTSCQLSGGDRRKVGYYTRLLMSLHHTAEAVIIPQWGRCSDHIGRKPILLLGLAGSVVSAILFGPSRSICALVLRV